MLLGLFLFRSLHTQVVEEEVEKKEMGLELLFEVS